MPLRFSPIAECRQTIGLRGAKIHVANPKMPPILDPCSAQHRGNSRASVKVGGPKLPGFVPKKSSCTKFDRAQNSNALRHNDLPPSRLKPARSKTPKSLRRANFTCERGHPRRRKSKGRFLVCSQLLPTPSIAKWPKQIIVHPYTIHYNPPRKIATYLAVARSARWRWARFTSAPHTVAVGSTYS